jgi:hypothetical protein
LSREVRETPENGKNDEFGSFAEMLYLRSRLQNTQYEMHV